MDHSSLCRGINIYLSYSSEDQFYLERLRIHLRPMEVDSLLQVWDEASIAPGACRLTEIERMIAVASVAVLLVSADFLASPEVNDHILPLILEKARLNTMTILSIIVSPCDFQSSSLAAYKPINNPARPLKTIREGEKEMVWQEVVQAIKITQREEQKKNKVVDADQPLSRQPKEVNAVPVRHPQDVGPVLDEAAIEQLINALLNAFPTQADLKLFIAYKLHENMEVIAAGNNLEERAFSLVMWAYSQGRMKALITGALARNPGNPKLRKFAMEHGF